ncbi:MAG TPA: nuclear transport factor 2 family protein [Pyrinomonadaceae bacterium]
MNRTAFGFLSLLLIVALSGLASCTKPVAPDSNREMTKASPTPRETVNPVAIEAEITKLENEWSAAAQRGDIDTLRRILADDLVITLVDGNVGDKAGEIKNAESGAVTAEAWELADTKVTVLSADSAFITGRGVIKKGKFKDPATGKVSDISGQYRFTDVYVRRNGQWQAVASQTTQIENPPPPASPSPSPTQ